MYVNDCRSKMCAGNASPSVTKQSVSTALVNGNNGLGPVVGNFCMDLAIDKARETGIGWVCARGELKILAPEGSGSEFCCFVDHVQ